VNRARDRVPGPVRAAAPGPGHRERGSATVELAVGLPVLVLLLLFALGAVDAVIARMECVDAARDGVLAAARGDDGTAAARDRAPAFAAVSVGRDGDRVRAEVRVRVRPLGPHLPGIEVSGTAVAEVEPSGTGSVGGAG
jgi:TadE-like protein